MINIHSNARTYLHSIFSGGGGAYNYYQEKSIFEIFVKKPRPPACAFEYTRLTRPKLAFL